MCQTCYNDINDNYNELCSQGVRDVVTVPVAKVKQVLATHPLCGGLYAVLMDVIFKILYIDLSCVRNMEQNNFLPLLEKLRFSWTRRFLICSSSL